jgi:EAL domain-containing protein (putative c-di-GMP-specific phosphodiesterase class I)
MSTLSHLRQFPIDVIKVDRTFVAGIEQDGGDLEVVKAVIGLGRALGMEVVAEGVETAEQAKILTSLGCPHAQGYYFGRPLPTEEFDMLLGRDRRLSPSI